MRIEPNAGKTALGARVATYRKLRGYKTPESLAKAIPDGRVSKSTIINIEAGRKSDPSVRDLLAIAYGLRISPLALLFDVERLFDAPGNELMVGEWADQPAILSLMFMAFEDPVSLDVESDGNELSTEPAYKVAHVRSALSGLVQANELRESIGEIEQALASGGGTGFGREVLEARLSAQHNQRSAQLEMVAALFRTAPSSGIEIPSDRSEVDQVVSAIETARVRTQKYRGAPA